MQAVVAKPINVAELCEVIGRALAGAKGGAPRAWLPERVA